MVKMQFKAFLRYFPYQNDIFYENAKIYSIWGQFKVFSIQSVFYRGKPLQKIFFFLKTFKVTHERPSKKKQKIIKRLTDVTKCNSPER